MSVRSIGTLFCNILSVILFEINTRLLRKEGYFLYFKYLVKSQEKSSLIRTRNRIKNCENVL